MWRVSRRAAMMAGAQLISQAKNPIARQEVKGLLADQ